MHEIKILNSLYDSFHAYPHLVAPRIPGALEDSRHVSHWCRSHFNQMPKLVPHDDFCLLNYELQVIPDVAIRGTNGIRQATKEARFVPSTYEGCGRQRREYNRQKFNYV